LKLNARLDRSLFLLHFTAVVLFFPQWWPFVESFIAKMFSSLFPALTLVSLASICLALPYIPEQEEYNLNQNKGAKSPLEYWGQWSNHQFHPSPDNWRMPFYSLFLDRFVNGDPSNDNINGTAFEVDLLSTQLRAGGDIVGLMDSLDYLQGMGIKVRRGRRWFTQYEQQLT
jgi:hypothetical protein